MGVLEFFGTLMKNDITSSSIKIDYKSRSTINHLFLDFNSIIHVSSVKVTMDINAFMQSILKNLYSKRSVNGDIFEERFVTYKMKDVQKKINQNTEPAVVVKLFQEHFTDAYLDKLIIILVINKTLRIIRTFCDSTQIKTLMIAIDGVPSKGKIVEQKQRRYIGAITEAYKDKIFKKYKGYIEKQPDNIIWGIEGAIKWNRNKITPGTDFMDKMSAYLKSEQIQEKFKTNRPGLNIILSDMYEVGEGEKKIVNYINKYLANTNDSVMVYSPDADVILLCMLLPVKNLFMLRYNDQTSAIEGRDMFDLIDIKSLKGNIAQYINNHPKFSKEAFDIDRINYDIVCISSLFGNDFVPKIETLNVKKGFQNIMDAYLKTLLDLKSLGYYLVDTPGKNRKEFYLNFIFLKKIILFLLPEEDDFITHNKLYAKYMSLGQIKNVFDYAEVSAENIVSLYNDFMAKYGDLKNLIKNNGNFSFFETNNQFMNSLKRSIVVKVDNQAINTSNLNNKEMIKLLKDYYRKNKSFPWLNINLNTWPHSVLDKMHRMRIKEKKMNDYQIEVYKFDKMLDEYRTKFSACQLDLTKDKINDYYKDYFGITLLTTDKPPKLTSDANQIMHDYLEGLLWVFNYYFNDKAYVNVWNYPHERAPLMRHFYMFLNSITFEYFDKVYEGLSAYYVTDLKTYFNPVEQLIYVSPMTEHVLALLPTNYKKFIKSDNLDPFLKNYFIDIYRITNNLWREKISADVDCRGIPFFNKCLIKSIPKPTIKDDVQFLRAIKKVKPTNVSIKRSKSVQPLY